MSIEDTFNSAVEGWREHCKSRMHDSSAQSVIECDAYRKIVSLGYPALPFIRELYDKRGVNVFDDFVLSVVKGHGLVDAVCEIVGRDFQIPKGLRGKVRATENYTKRWLDENMHRYVSSART